MSTTPSWHHRAQNTLEEMTPLFYAVYHGCQAGKHQEALGAVYYDRIQRGDEFFLTKKRGAFGIDLSLLANFFVTPWSKPIALAAADQSWVTVEAAFVLRALGRLREAVEPLEAAVDAFRKMGNWKDVSKGLGNLSELHLTLGNIREAIGAARRSVESADKSEDEFLPMLKRTTLADALHQSGDLAEAARLFEEAERMQVAREPAYPILYSLQGYRYCDLLLARGQNAEVLRRAMQTLSWQQKQNWLLDIALDHLSLGRAHPPGSTEAAQHLDEAVNGLRRAGQLDYLPRGLLARAAHFRHTGDFEKAQHDLDEVRILATRCGMRLFLADYHLEQARLFLAQQNPDDTRPHYESAKKLIEETGYHRRDPELGGLSTQL
jgi:tetratricopeptide (TPR) repeat protein